VSRHAPTRGVPGRVWIALGALFVASLGSGLLGRGAERSPETDGSADERTANSAQDKEAPSAWSLWRRNSAVWIALMALLLISFGAAYLPLGAFNTVVGLLIALIKAGLVAVLFMELRHSGALMRLAGATGLLFVFVMFVLTLSDFMTRLSGS
jgi:cytochrome c oxidase subunit IV